MKAIVVKPGDHGPRLVWEKAPEAAMGPEEVLVAVRATAVNRADLLQARGQYPPPPGVTDILGLEIAGTVSAFGNAVQGWQ
ncbi:MAG: alcohol dehydrogenase catalytic domain-containing protein, partial [Hyphomicrobiales bacterium]